VRLFYFQDLNFHTYKIILTFQIIIKPSQTFYNIYFLTTSKIQSNTSFSYTFYRYLSRVIPSGCGWGFACGRRRLQVTFALFYFTLNFI